MNKENKNGKGLSEEKLDKISGGGNFRPGLLTGLPPWSDPFYESFPNTPHKPLKNKNIEIGGNKSWAKRTKMKRN